MPERVLRILQHLREQTTAVELAEVLWLAQRVPQGENAPLALALLRESGGGAPPSEDAGADTGTAPEAMLPPSLHEEEGPSELHATAEQPEADSGTDDADTPPGDAGSQSDADADADADTEGAMPMPMPMPIPRESCPRRRPRPNLPEPLPCASRTRAPCPACW
ncbi:hypothetical protein STRAU_1733 [Streptomyces aurantiacus JA 4570]|uniref:Uncharacterized protein n=1 Tax=Streptomyces aurantiacus JA 4570 TaxID=1286094 RepID=S4A337_9ACTN|nr:hypothetical protein [Streptomyces aurantiacus]EPH45105.1 hypothetical protein STRAU_1733 [Streptomyces aurantiacus JA 4570]